MAQLPGIPLRPQAGQSPSLNVVEPTDLGLGAAAQNMAAWQREREQTQRLEEEVQAKADEKAVQPILDGLKAPYEREFQEQAALYDGTAPGWSKAQIDRFEEHARPVLDRQDLPAGQAAALRRGVDQFREVVGQRAISVEGQKAGGRVAEMERARQTAILSDGFGDYMTTFGAESGALDQTFDGSQPNYVADKLAAHDRAAARALEGVPEAQRAGLQIKLNAERLDVQAKAMADAATGHQTFVASKARSAGEKLANAVLSNPNLIGGADRALDEALASVPAEARGKAREELRGKLAAARVRGLIDKGRTAVAIQELEGGRWDAWLSPEAKATLLNGVRADAGERARNAIEALHYGGTVDSEALLENARVSGDEGLAAVAQYRLEVGWAEEDALGSGGGRRGGFSEAASFVIDELEGGETLVENDNGRGATRFGINQAANPDLNVRKLTRPAAVNRYRARYWNAIEGDRLAPDLALVAFDAAVNQGPDAAKAMLAQAGGDTGRLLALREARYRALAAQPGQAGNLKGWLARLTKVRGEAARVAAFVNTKDGLASDPIKYAAGSKALRSSVPVLPGEPGEAAWAQGLQGRRTLARRLNESYRAPLRMLTNAEASFYKDRIERDPTQGVAMAQAATAAIGPAGARDLLAELGLQSSATAQLHVADLAAAGLTGFAETAARGLALGEKATADKEKLDGLRDAVEARKGLLAGQPEARLAIQAVAEAALRADSQTGAPKSATYYLNSALGGSVRGGKRYGGLATLNGAETILPPWLAADYADDVLQSLARGWETNGLGPVWTNGKPMAAAEIARLRLQLMPNGHYRLLDKRGVAMAGRGGAAFEMDLDKAAPGLRRQFGAVAVLEGW